MLSVGALRRFVVLTLQAATLAACAPVHASECSRVLGSHKSEAAAELVERLDYVFTGIVTGVDHELLDETTLVPAGTTPGGKVKWGRYRVWVLESAKGGVTSTVDVWKHVSATDYEPFVGGYWGVVALQDGDRIVSVNRDLDCEDYLLFGMDGRLPPWRAVGIYFGCALLVALLVYIPYRLLRRKL